VALGNAQQGQRLAVLPVAWLVVLLVVQSVVLRGDRF
jgi:hypothetical protein